MSTKKITFSTYPSIQAKFKDQCQLLSVSMAERIEQLINAYMDGKLGTLADLEDCLLSVKMHSPKEIKNFKLTIYIDAALYDQLKKHLSEMEIRPATFLTDLLSFAICQMPSMAEYKKRAEIALQISDPEIFYVVYALEYCKPNATDFTVTHTEYILDCCSKDRFSKIYEKYLNSPLIHILYVQRNKKGTV